MLTSSITSKQPFHHKVHRLCKGPGVQTYTYNLPFFQQSLGSGNIQLQSSIFFGAVMGGSFTKPNGLSFSTLLMAMRKNPSE